MAGPSAVDIWLGAASRNSDAGPSDSSTRQPPVRNTPPTTSVWESFTTSRRNAARASVDTASTSRSSVWQSHLQAQPDVYKPHAQCWDASLPARRLHWQNQCGAYFQRPRVCAFCGAFKLGNILSVANFTHVQPTGQAPPYALSNAFLAQYTMSIRPSSGQRSTTWSNS